MRFFLFTFCILFTVHGSSWPAWRGIKQDGKSDEAVSLSANLKKTVWEAEVGEGYSSVSVFRDYLITAGNSDEKDTIYCLSAKSGKEIWKYSYECQGRSSYPGTRATPVTDGKAVYMLSRKGHLHCLNLKSGKVIWMKNVVSDLGYSEIMYGLSASVAVGKKNIYLNVGEMGVALDKKDGSVVWKSAPKKGGYCTPVMFSNKKREYLAILGENKLFVLEKDTGKLAASYDFKSAVCDPVINKSGDKLFVTSAGSGNGSVLLNFDGKSLKEIWKNTKLESLLSTPVLHKGTLYGASGSTGKGKMVAVDYKTGKVLWESKKRYGSMIMAKNALIYLNERGTLHLVRPSTAKADIVASNRVLKKGKCWSMPVLANGMIYCRSSKGKLIALKAI